jgi:hypothetical protein
VRSTDQRFLHCRVTTSLLGPKIVLNTLFSNTLSIGPFLSVSDQVSHTHKITGKTIFLYFVRENNSVEELISKFLYITEEK